MTASDLDRLRIRLMTTQCSSSAADVPTLLLNHPVDITEPWFSLYVKVRVQVNCVLLTRFIKLFNSTRVCISLF